MWGSPVVLLDEGTQLQQSFVPSFQNTQPLFLLFLCPFSPLHGALLAEIGKQALKNMDWCLMRKESARLVLRQPVASQLSLIFHCLEM